MQLSTISCAQQRQDGHADFRREFWPGRDEFSQLAAEAFGV
jgi:hypothetical protein